MSEETNSSSLACVLAAIEPDKREAHLKNAQKLFGSVEAIREVDDGYEFRFATSADTLASVAEFISLERYCCPFFNFNLLVESESGPTWLSLTGRKGVKAFIRVEIGEFLSNPELFPT